MLSIVIKSSEDNNNKIINECKDIYNLKIEVDNMLNERLGIHYNKYKLITNENEINKIFGNIYTYIPNFIRYIWNNPKAVATILSVTPKKDIQNNLAHFIVHNLYENIFSSNGKQDQLLYIITLLIKEEINNLETENDKDINMFKFLNETSCGYILEELLLKKEVQSFFNIIINDIIKNIDKICSLNPISFDLDEITTKFLKKEIINENIDFNSKFKGFKFEQYMVSLNKKQLEEEVMKCKDPEIKKLLRTKIEECQANPNLYSNDKVLNKIYQNENSLKIFTYYQQSFGKIINLINLLLDNLLLNSKTMPYYIKCICKIISIFIQKKFPELSKIEQNAYVANFFFGKLLFIAFKNPALLTLMNQRLILGKNMEILRTIKYVLNRFIEGNFFDEGNSYVPFNIYFLEKMPTLMKFFENLNQVVLPSFIDKFINNQLNQDYIYDYFQENPSENIFYRQICFNVDILYSLIINADKCKNKINFPTKNDIKTLEKLIYNIKELEEIKNKEIINNQTNEGFELISVKKTILYFLISDTINNKKYENILNINREKDYFSLKEIKTKETLTEEKAIQNNIIKVKNYFFSFLYNFPTLNKNDFNQENLSNIINILKEIKENSNLNSNIYENQNIAKINPMLDSLIQFLPILQQRNISTNQVLEKNLTKIAENLSKIKESFNKNISINSYQKPIPIKWFLGSLIQFLPQLPKEYIENNFEKLFNEIENDINNSIKEIDFEFLSEKIDHIREIEKNKYHYQNVKNIITDIDLNKLVYKIVEGDTENIPIYLEFKDDELEIRQAPNKEKRRKTLFTSALFTTKIKIDEEENICTNIKQFIKKFPDLTIYESLQDEDMIELMKKIDLPAKLNIYFDVIKEYLTGKKNSNELFLKIYDYIMEQLYDKLFPKEISRKDIKITQNCFRLAWIQPTDMIQFHKNYILDYYLPDAIDYFKKINEEKSPRKKFVCIKEIYNCLYNLGKFNEDKVEGADDEIPLLNYTFIKANPQNIYNNCRYMNLFIGEQKNKIEGNQLSKMLGLCEFVENISHKDLINITEKEYKEKCLLVNNEGAYMA